MCTCVNECVCVPMCVRESVCLGVLDIYIYNVCGSEILRASERMQVSMCE